MASILDLLNTKKGGDFIAKAGKTTSENEEKVSAVLSVGLPILLAAMKIKSNTNQGRDEINEAIDREEFGADFLNKIKDVDSKEIINQGNNLLKLLLGPNTENVTSTISGILNVDDTSVSKILKMAAPLLLSILSSQKQMEKIEPSSIGELINSVLGTSNKFDTSLIESFLDNKGDSRILDDVQKVVLGGSKGKKGGSILGGMTGGK